MTDQMTHCIRGCVRPCGCDACAGKDQPEHPPVPRPAVRGLLCGRDETRLWAWMNELVDLWATLSTELTDGGDKGGTAHLKVSGSPALVNLFVVSLMDPRTDPAGYTGADGQRVASEGPPHVPTTIGSWARLVSEERELSGPFGTLVEAVGVLTNNFEWICEQPWVDELWAEVKEVRGLLGRAHGEKRPKMVGRCLTVHEVDGVVTACDRALYLPEGGDRLKCGRCGRVYDGRGLLMVRLQGEVAS